jgi:hypothetical protein
MGRVVAMTTAATRSDNGYNTNAAKSLNEQNWPGLLAITTLNLIVFAVVIGTDPTPFSKLATAWAFLLPAGVGLAMIRVINGLIDTKTKHRLIFWKWQHPLPGCEAYTVHAKNDERFTEIDVSRELGVSATEMADPRKQNAHWYSKVFYPTQDKPAVQQAERNFLFTRDYTAISFIMFIALGVSGYFVINSASRWVLYSGGLILQYLLVRWAARNYGIETVTNAIAARLTELQPPISGTHGA